MDQTAIDAKNARRRALYAAEPERRVKEKQYAEQRTWQQRMLNNARARSKRYGWPDCDLTQEDLVIPSVCPVLGIALQQSPGKRPGPNTPSMDRVIPELGYVKGNVEIISYRATRLKNDATYQELRAISVWLEAKANRR